jgi:hypothetical protein
LRKVRTTVPAADFVDAERLVELLQLPAVAAAVRDVAAGRQPTKPEELSIK